MPTLEEKQTAMQERIAKGPVNPRIIPGSAKDLRRKARARKLAREQQRRYRERKKARQAESEPFVLDGAENYKPSTPARPVPPCSVCGKTATIDLGNVAYCPAHSQAALQPVVPVTPEVPAFVPSPPVPLPRPTFDTEDDPRRPSWFPPTVIELTLEPRQVRRLPPIGGEGLQTAQIGSEGLTFSEASGHVNPQAEGARQAAETERRRFDHSALLPGETL